MRASAAQGWQHSLHLLSLLSLSLPGEFLDLALVDSVLGACARSLAWRQALKALELLGSWDASCLVQALHACESLHKGPQCEVLRQALGAALSRSALRSPSRKANDRSERGIFGTSLHGLVVLASWVRARTCGQPSAGPSTSMALERKVLQEQDGRTGSRFVEVPKRKENALHMQISCELLRTQGDPSLVDWAVGKCVRFSSSTSSLQKPARCQEKPRYSFVPGSWQVEVE